MRSKNSQVFTGEAIEDVSLAEKAASIVRKKILCGELAQGMRITENELAQALGVSKICIREAFKMLEYEGLIVKAVNKYTQVVELSLQDIKEIFELRAAIEACCLEEAMKNRSLPFEKMRESAAFVDQRYTGSLESAKTNPWVEPDFLFHGIIVMSSENGRAIEAWLRLRNQAILALYNADYIPHRAGITHKDLVDDIEYGDTRIACEKLTRHIIDAYINEESKRLVADEAARSPIWSAST